MVPPLTSKTVPIMIVIIVVIIVGGIIAISKLTKHNVSDDWYFCSGSDCIKCTKNSEIAGCMNQSYTDCRKMCIPPSSRVPPPPSSRVPPPPSSRVPPPPPPSSRVPPSDTPSVHTLLNGTSVPNLVNNNGKIISPVFNVDADDNITLSTSAGVIKRYSVAGVKKVDNVNYQIKASTGDTSVDFFVNLVGEPSISSNDTLFSKSPAWPLADSNAKSIDVQHDGLYQLPVPWTLANSDNTQNPDVAIPNASACVKYLQDNGGIGARYSEVIIENDPSQVAKSCEIWTGKGGDPRKYACTGGDSGGPGIEIMKNQENVLAWLTYLNPKSFNNTPDPDSLKRALQNSTRTDVGQDYIGWC